ncbi:transaldolase [Streptomyces xanthochromogenes]|uniref:transaldolase n=1 Tax=Streptomyces xanthochromogenes TaxID=67384 RepID=UPI00379FBB55
MNNAMNDVFTRLAGEGVSVWLDDFQRSGTTLSELRRAVGPHGVTGAVGRADAFAELLHTSPPYRSRIRELSHGDLTAEELVWALTTQDVRTACDELRAAHERTAGRDGFASVDVDPRNAWDAGATVAEARALWRTVNRPNLLVKIPATAPNLAAISTCLAEGIGVNAVAIFSPDRYAQVSDAFLDGLERARAAGRDLRSIASVASFSVNCLDVEVDRELDRAGSAEARAMSGKAGIANARLAYEIYEDSLASPRWRALAAAGAAPQRLAWTSTARTTPARPDTSYVEELVAPDTVSVLSGATLLAVADHGEVRGDSVRRHYAESRRVLSYLSWFGISYRTVVSSLEAVTLRQSAATWDALLTAVRGELDPQRRTLAPLR